eukprot:g47190.t1
MELQVPMDSDKSNEEEVEAPILKGAVDVAKAQQSNVCLDKKEIQKNVVEYLLGHSDIRDAVNKKPLYADRLPNFVTTLLSVTKNTTPFQFIFSTTITRFAILAPKEKSGHPQTILADAAQKQDDAGIVVSLSNLGNGEQLSMFPQRYNGATPILPDQAAAWDYKIYDQVEGRPHDDNIALNEEDQNTTNSVPSKATSSQPTKFQKIQELERRKGQARADLEATRQALQTANANARKIPRLDGKIADPSGGEIDLGEVYDFITGLDWGKARPLQDENKLTEFEEKFDEFIGYLVKYTKDPQSKKTFEELGNAIIIFLRALHETAATLQAVDKELAALAKAKPRRSKKVRRKRSSSNKGEGMPNANPDEAAVQEEEGATTQGLETEEGQQVLDVVPDDAAAQEDAVQVIEGLEIEAAETEALVGDAEKLLLNAADAARNIELQDVQVHVPVLEKEINLKAEFHDAMARLLINPATVDNNTRQVIEAAATQKALDDDSKRNLEALLESVTLVEQQKEALAKKMQEIKDARNALGKKVRKKPGKARITKPAVSSKVVPGAAAGGKRGFLLEQLKKIPNGYTYAEVPSINVSRNAAAQEECQTAVLVWRWQGTATMQVAKGALESCWTKFRRALCSAKPDELAFEVLLTLPDNTWDLVCKPSSFLEDREVATKQLEGIVRVLALDKLVRGEHEVQLPPAIKTKLLLTAHNMLFSGTVGAPLSEGLSRLLPKTVVDRRGLFLKYGRSPLTMQDQQFFRQYELCVMPEKQEQYDARFLISPAVQALSRLNFARAFHNTVRLVQRIQKELLSIDNFRKQHACCLLVVFDLFKIINFTRCLGVLHERVQVDAQVCQANFC